MCTEWKIEHTCGRPDHVSYITECYDGADCPVKKGSKAMPTSTKTQTCLVESHSGKDAHRPGRG